MLRGSALGAFASGPIVELFAGAPAFGFTSSRLETCVYGSGLKSEVNIPWLKSLRLNVTVKALYSNYFFIND